MHKLIIFDFDGTLGDTHDCTVATLNAVFRRASLPGITDEMVAPLFGSPIELIVESFLGDKSTPALVEKLVHEYRALYPTFIAENTRLFPGVQALLDALAAQGLLCVIATTKVTKLAELTCEFLGIRNYFRIVVGSDKVANPKPDPETAQYILRQLTMKPEDALIVGDSRFDIWFGQNAGIDTVAVTWGPYSEAELAALKPTVIIRQAAELLHYV